MDRFNFTITVSILGSRHIAGRIHEAMSEALENLSIEEYDLFSKPAGMTVELSTLKKEKVVR